MFHNIFYSVKKSIFFVISCGIQVLEPELGEAFFAECGSGVLHWKWRLMDKQFVLLVE